MSWEMYAHKFEKDGNTYFRHVGDKWWVELHGINEPIVKVLVTPDTNGFHWGWMPSDSDKPIMIQPHISLLRMCFAYGIEIAEKNGDGKRIQLTIIEIPDDNS